MVNICLKVLRSGDFQSEVFHVSEKFIPFLSQFLQFEMDLMRIRGDWVLRAIQVLDFCFFIRTYQKQTYKKYEK